MIKRTVLFLFISLSFFFLPQHTFAATTVTYEQMDLATLYWIYFDIPFPQASGISPTMKITVPIVTTAPSISQAPTPTPTRTQVKDFISTPTPTKSPQATSTVAKTQTISSSESYFIQQINAYRASQGLGPVQTDSNTCSFAKTRAGEIVGNFNHDGFTNRINNHTLPYPSYHEVTENIAMNSDYTQVVPGWINSPGHAANMRADTPYVCVESSGNYYAYEGWKP